MNTRLKTVAFSTDSFLMLPMLRINPRFGSGIGAAFMLSLRVRSSIAGGAFALGILASLFSASAGIAGQVIAWGDNSFGQTNVPPGLTNVLAIAGGAYHSLGLNSDGTVTAWGGNSSGQTDVPIGLSNVIAIAGGEFHSLALKVDGSITAWGDDSFGQANVPPGLSNAVAIAAGSYHNLALKADGAITSWGDNRSQQLEAPPGLGNVVAMAAGHAHSVALKADGTVVAWGDNRSGQTNAPVGLNNVMKIAAGGLHSLALKANGWIVSWGAQNSVPGNSANYGATIISTSPGTSETNISKWVAFNGNVVVDNGTSGLTVIDGGGGYAALANGQANIANTMLIPTESVSMTNWGTVEQIPDYTSRGTTDSLFDFNRLMAVADATGTHFTNLSRFISANNLAAVSPAGALEGVIVVDISANDKSLGNLHLSSLPNGINVRGTLGFNFASNLYPSWKIINTAPININKADLTGLNPTNPATYTSGYPPSYFDEAKNPINVDITARGHPNFTSVDELPALIQNTAIFDIHGPANICGTVFSPSVLEIENKNSNQTQYFRGTLIGGGGIYLENNRTNTPASTSMFSSAPKSVGIVARASQNLARKANGTIVGWGGQTNVPAGLSNVVAVAAGASHSLALIGGGVPTIRPRFSNPSSTDNHFTVSLPTQSGRVYALEYKNVLTDSQWTALPLVAGHGGLQALVDPTASVAQRFYRVRQW